jgi:hypothetical protein
LYGRTKFFLSPILLGELHSHLTLGYVPDPLVGYVADVLRRWPYILSVVTVNSADTNPHLRLLLHLDGVIAADTFNGPEWRTAA